MIARRAAFALLLAGLAPVAAHAAEPHCPHAWVPFEAGTAWTYRLAGDRTVTLRILDVRQGDGWAVAEVGAFPDGATVPARQTTFTCDGDGVVLPFGPLLAEPSIELTVLKEQGVTLPPAAKLADGAAWSSRRWIRIERGGGRSGVEVETEHTARATEAVRTGAGRYQAIPVDVSAGGRTGRVWFARRVGLVKTSGEAAEPSAELIRFEPAGGTPSSPR